MCQILTTKERAEYLELTEVTIYKYANDENPWVQSGQQMGV
jgi:hypothetical protein